MDRPEIRDLSYFVTVAEELHFARAAERLGITSPPLSRAIAQLERRMGVRLFDRTSRRVSLTESGQVFLTECRIALAAVDTAVRRAQRVSRPRRLVVAIRPGTGSSLLNEILEAYGAPVKLLFTLDQPAALRDGTADVAVVCLSADLDGLVSTPVGVESSVALLPAAHDLATRREVSIDDLRRDDTYLTCPAWPLDEIVDRVALGDLVTVVGDGAVSRIGDAVRAVPVVGLPDSVVTVSHADGNESAELTAFVLAAKDVTNRRLVPLDDGPARQRQYFVHIGR